MINLRRREPFALELHFDGELGKLHRYALLFSQGGRAALVLRGRETEPEGEGLRADVLLRADETARFRPDLPLYAQVQATLADGTELYSEAAELNVIDVMEEGRSRAWNRH